MFTLRRTGFFRRAVRLTSASRLNADDFRTLAGMLGASAIRARKIGRVAARRAGTRARFETRWNGKESQITAEAGDWIVTTLSPTAEVLRDGCGQVNSYAIKAQRLDELYVATAEENQFGRVYCAKGVVEALYLSGGFEIVAPWGEIQRADTGYLLLNGNEVYGNNRDTFEATYAVLA